MTCSHCGTELPPGAMFCGECGRAVPSRGAKAAVVEVVEPTEDPVVLAELAEPASAVEELVEVAELASAPVEVAEPVSAPFEELIDAPAAVAPTDEPGPQPEPEPSDVAGVADFVDDAETCAQCGALLATSDIFCGECGFVRRSPTRPNDTAVLDPFPWGLPRSTEHPPHHGPAESPASPASVAEAAVTVPHDPGRFADDIDETRIVDRTVRGDRFVLQFSTGESVSVSGTGLVGRNPVAEPGEFFDSFVTISDPGKSVSKTHLEFGQDGGAFWVSDRYSGNGTVVIEPERGPLRCDPGKRYRIVRGTRVEIGEQFFIVS